ncbi:C-C motif chemokine 13-like [Paroedura picta]|uniref:C-C motif chemokine 13-like n=1 Tax=Paroedura picta TaxID=143630 RepID=UPI004055F742
MNSSMAALALFLVAGFFWQSQAQPVQPSDCCTGYTQKAIPLKLLASYEVVTSRCNLPAVVFYTKAGRSICVDPKKRWTLERMEKLPVRGQERTP